MSSNAEEGIEGLEPQELFRAALGDASGDPEAAERAAEEEKRVRAEIEERLPDLELFELLGRGGMGYVYRARQKKLDREVALKVIAPEAEGRAGFAERFAREAQALARLNHPNLVAVHDYGQDGSFGWLVMEYVDGSNLRDLIRAGKLEPAEALALVPKICDALQYAHDQGVVHRDVKPENILIDREGGVKIADFGLAKLIGTPAALVSLTGTQEVLGTFRYMAPEQLDSPLEVDHRADIYSLGVVFYEMLTGEIPMGRFDPPSLCSTASVDVDEVVLRALQKEPARRYQRASEVKSDLESLGRESRGAEPVQKIATFAVASVVFSGAGSLPLVYAAVIVLSKLGRSGVAFSPSLSVLAMTIFGLVLMFIGRQLGVHALNKIRHAWPRLHGAGAAIVGAWGGILLIANVMILALSLELSNPAAIPPPVLVAAPLLLLASDVVFIILYRRRFLESCRAE